MRSIKLTSIDTSSRMSRLGYLRASTLYRMSKMPRVRAASEAFGKGANKTLKAADWISRKGSKVLDKFVIWDETNCGWMGITPPPARPKSKARLFFEHKIMNISWHMGTVNFTWQTGLTFNIATLICATDEAERSRAAKWLYQHTAMIHRKRQNIALERYTNDTPAQFHFYNFKDHYTWLHAPLFSIGLTWEKYTELLRRISRINMNFIQKSVDPQQKAKAVDRVRREANTFRHIVDAINFCTDNADPREILLRLNGGETMPGRVMQDWDDRPTVYDYIIRERRARMVLRFAPRIYESRLTGSTLTGRLADLAGQTVIADSDYTGFLQSKGIL